jgi:hypothetical protein
MAVKNSKFPKIPTFSIPRPSKLYPHKPSGNHAFRFSNRMMDPSSQDLLKTQTFNAFEVNGMIIV